MKGKLIMLVAIIIIAGLGIYYWSNMSTSEYFESDWGETGTGTSGSWAQHILLEFEDGSIKSIKELSENPSLAVLYEGQEVTLLHYKLLGRGTGGSGSVEVFPVDFSVLVKTHEMTSYDIVNTYTLGTGGTHIEFAIDGNWKTLLEWDACISKIIPSSLADATYDVILYPQGNLDYSINGGPTKTSDAPNNVGLELTKLTSGEVQFAGEVTVS